MKRFKSKEQLEAFLDEQFAWRRKELHDFKVVIREKKDSTELKALLKGGIVIAYSHWEGYVKEVSCAYLEYVSFRNDAQSEIADNFLALSVFNKVKKANKLSDCINDICKLRDSPNSACKIPVKDIIDAESNLNSDVLKNIMTLIGLDFSVYERKIIFLDRQVLKYRNEIAHGENKFVKMDDYLEIFDFILSAMDQYKSLIQNSIQMNYFLKKDMRVYEY